MTIVNTNTKALLAQQAMTVNQRELTHAMAQLATGKRINSAADDAAGSAISSRMAMQIASLGQSVRNANDGISMLQTADGAAQGVTDILHRMKELSVQYLNGTNGTTEKTAIDKEFANLTTEIGNIISSTTWNNIQVLAAAGAGSRTFQVGAASTDTVTATFTDFAAAGKPIKIAQALTSVTDATTLDKIDSALGAVNDIRAGWGAAISQLEHAADNSTNVSMNLAASQSRILDADYAQSTADLARAQIVQQAGTAMLSQANQMPYMVMALLR